MHNEPKRRYGSDEAIVLASGGDWWGEYTGYTREDWQEEVAAGNTQMGYWGWVRHKLDEEDL